MINEELKKYRKYNKLTQKQIADILKVDRSTYAYYENGKNTPGINILSKLSRIYDVPIDYLLGNADVYSSHNQMLQDELNFYNDKHEEMTYLSELCEKEQEVLLLFRLIRDKDKALQALKKISEKESE